MQSKILTTLLSIGLSGFLFGTTLNSPASAETTIERIERTGVIRAGASKDTKPFGYVDEQGNWVGYGIDMMRVIKSQLEKALQKPLQLELVESTTQNRFDLIIDDKVDIACGADSFTWNREKYVDFSLSYFVTGTQLLVKKGTPVNSLAELRTYTIGVEPETTNEAILQVLDPRLTLVKINSSQEAIAELESGAIDIYAGDGVLLEAMRAEMKNSNRWEIIPDDDLINRESYGCLLPQNDSQWRDFVNYSIIRAIQGYVMDDPEFNKMFETWFGETGVVPYPEDVLKEHYQGILNTVERIPSTAY